MSDSTRPFCPRCENERHMQHECPKATNPPPDEIERATHRIANNGVGDWWQSLTDSHRKALKANSLSMMKEAFRAGVRAALTDKPVGGE